MTRIFEDRLGPSSGYNTAVRPIKNQSQVIEVEVDFELISITEIDEVQQKFVANGFFGFYWKDELVGWDLKEYDNNSIINPYPKDIWRPRVILVNTKDKRDLFGDDISPTYVQYHGAVSWHPGSLFPVSCKLNMHKFPFDIQNCQIEMYPLFHGKEELQFISKTREVITIILVKSGEWELLNASVETNVLDEQYYSTILVKFKLKRLPGYFVINIITPVVLLSFLNILVFIIPVDSGDKISYSITVLLALTLFMSMVSQELPRSSDTIPLITIYILVLAIISVCSVIVTILIVLCHHINEKRTKLQKVASNHKNVFHKFSHNNRTVTPFKDVQRVKPVHTTASCQQARDQLNLFQYDKNLENKLDRLMNALKDLKSWKPSLSSESLRDESEESENENDNQWLMIGHCLNSISFVVFMGVWVSLTVGFLIGIVGVID